MAEKTIRELEIEIERQKKQRKILIICSTVGFIIGLVFGVISAILDATKPNEYIAMTGVEKAKEFLWGIWLGTGFGVFLSSFSIVTYIYNKTAEKHGSGKGLLAAALWGIGFWGFIFGGGGFIGLALRLLIIFFIIKRCEKLIEEKRLEEK